MREQAGKGDALTAREKEEHVRVGLRTLDFPESAVKVSRIGDGLSGAGRELVRREQRSAFARTQHDVSIAAKQSIEQKTGGEANAYVISDLRRFVTFRLYLASSRLVFTNDAAAIATRASADMPRPEPKVLTQYCASDSPPLSSRCRRSGTAGCTQVHAQRGWCKHETANRTKCAESSRIEAENVEEPDASPRRQC